MLLDGANWEDQVRVCLLKVTEEADELEEVLIEDQ